MRNFNQIFWRQNNCFVYVVRKCAILTKYFAAKITGRKCAIFTDNFWRQNGSLCLHNCTAAFVAAGATTLALPLVPFTSRSGGPVDLSSSANVHIGFLYQNWPLVYYEYTSTYQRSS